MNGLLFNAMVCHVALYGPASPVNSLRPNATASPPGVPRPADSVDGLAAGVCVLGGPALPWPCPPRIRFPVRRRY